VGNIGIGLGDIDMNREILTGFQGKIVRLVLDPHFVLTGTIDMVDDDSILFTTNQKTSAIHFSKIMEVYPI
jgi:ribosome maturation factor RimP